MGRRAHHGAPQIDFVTLVTQTAVELVVDHLQRYRAAVETLQVERSRAGHGARSRVGKLFLGILNVFFYSTMHIRFAFDVCMFKIIRNDLILILYSTRTTRSAHAKETRSLRVSSRARRTRIVVYCKICKDRRRLERGLQRQRHRPGQAVVLQS